MKIYHNDQRYGSYHVSSGLDCLDKSLFTAIVKQSLYTNALQIFLVMA